jgi:hypothetical protein
MLHVKLVPDLSHCVETVARREYEDMLKQLLGRGEANKELQKRLEILRLFLQTVDFKMLRTESEHYLIAKSELINSQQIRKFEFPKFRV